METFVGDTPKIVLQTGIDLSVYSTLLIKFRRPDGTYGAWTASLSSEDNTWMEYTTLDTDLNLPGIWALQSHVMGIGIELHGKWVDIQVYTPIADVIIWPS